jgi:hypothetical protein
VILDFINLFQGKFHCLATINIWKSRSNVFILCATSVFHVITTESMFWKPQENPMMLDFISRDTYWSQQLRTSILVLRGGKKSSSKEHQKLIRVAQFSSSYQIWYTSVRIGPQNNSLFPRVQFYPHTHACVSNSGCELIKALRASANQSASHLVYFCGRQRTTWVTAIGCCAATLITYQDTLWRLVASWPPIESWGLVDGGQIGLVTAHTSADTTKFNTEVHCI